MGQLKQLTGIKTMSDKIYQMITDQILEELKKGVIPWEMPWVGGRTGLPKNIISNKEYRGVNIMLLSMMQRSKGYNSNYWITFKQAKQAKGYIRKGEKGTIVIFWRFLKVKEKNDAGKEKEKTIPMLRYYKVFNTDQCENLDHKRIKELQEKAKENAKHNLDFVPIEKAESILNNYKNMVDVNHTKEKRACYNILKDEITMPEKESFKSIEQYYSVLFHETIHSTRHPERLDRKKENSSFGSEDYSKEELVAEMGACYLCGIVRIEKITIKNSASYIKGWMEALKDDNKILIHASGQAQKAVDYILTNEKPNYDN